MLSSLPLSPGVYWFLDNEGNVLYVGKAKNLKNRVTSYARYNQLSHRIKQLVTTATTVKFRILDSELEALLVEAELIGRYQPHFNILLKDDKSPLYIHITNEQFPRVTKIRKKELLTKKLAGTTLGPFPSAYKVNEVLKIARTIFPWCNKPLQETLATSQKTPTACFFYHLDLCPGACLGHISKEAYVTNITNLIAFLKGKKKEVLQAITADMTQAVAQENFELAAQFRDQLQLIKEVTGRSYTLKPDLTLPALRENIAEDGRMGLQKLLTTYSFVPSNYALTRIEGYDVSNTQGTLASVAMVTFINGKPDTNEYKVFNIKTLNTPNDYHMLKEALTRRQNHPEWGKPNVVVIDGGRGQVRAVLSTWTWDIPVIGIAKHPDRLIIPIFKQPPRQKPTSVTYHIAKLQPQDPILQLVQQIRDEAHRFSKKQHSGRRVRKLLDTKR